MKIKKINFKTQYPIRAPYENALRIDHDAKLKLSWLNDGLEKSLEGAVDDPRRYESISKNAVLKLNKAVVMLHARGEPLKVLTERLLEAIEYAEYTRTRFSDTKLSDSYYLTSNELLGIALLLISDTHTLERFISLIEDKPDVRLYHIDILIKAFYPKWQLLKSYKRSGHIKSQYSWGDPLNKALRSSDPSKALANFMKSYERIIKPYRPYMWQPWDEYVVSINLDEVTEHGNAFHHFAFVVALAVCAYDLDDSDFRDHAYYPREVVDYYRFHIRNSRDSWRENGEGAGVAIKPPPKAKKIDLAKSKSKNFKRWVELIADADPDVTKSVLSLTGSLRKVKDVESLFSTLNESNVVIYADGKDSDTLESVLIQLLKERGIDTYEPPASNPKGGHGRCKFLLDHSSKWLEKHNYVLYVVDLRSDSYGCVLVARNYQVEFQTLSAKLGVCFLES